MSATKAKRPAKRPRSAPRKGPSRVRKGVQKVRSHRPDGTFAPDQFAYDTEAVAPVNVSEAKKLVANLLAKSQASGVRPREMAELLRVYAAIAELEAKLSAEDVEGIVIIDVDPQGFQIVKGRRMKLVRAS